eukprot:322285_1
MFTSTNIILLPALFICIVSSDCDVWQLTSSRRCDVECNNQYTGFIASGSYANFYLTLTDIQRVTFTNCQSVDFTPYYFKLFEIIEQNNYIPLTDSSDGECTGTGSCQDDENYVCYTAGRSTFTFSYLPAGWYKLQITNPEDSEYLYGKYAIEIFCGAPGSEVVFESIDSLNTCHESVYEPDSSATLSPWTNGEFPGHSLFFKGFNIFTTSQSGSPIFDSDYVSANTESYSTEGSSCAYSSLQFDSQYAHFSDFAVSHAASIQAAYQSGDTYGAGGSLSGTRTETRSYAESAQYYIYSMDFECIAATASIVELNEVHWNTNFIKALMILPTEYSTGDDLEEYIDFWNSYGTHIFESALLGGSISGAVTSSKCSVAKSFVTSDEYELCLNAAYKGVSIDGCKSVDDSSSVSTALSESIQNKWIEVKGGDASKYESIFNSFGCKTFGFGSWITDLGTYPGIIGGNVMEIHDAIQRAIKLGQTLGQHNLNLGLIAGGYSVVDDDTFLSISDALEAAFDDYAKQLAAEYNYFGKGECSIDCNGYTHNTTECVCAGCNSVKQCCGIDDANRFALNFTVMICGWIAFFVPITY